MRLRLLFTAKQKGAESAMTESDVLFGYRLQLFALAAERGVSEACRLMGVRRSSYYLEARGRPGRAGDAAAA